MTTQSESERPQGAPPRWLLPAMVATLIVLAGLLAVAITTRNGPRAAVPAQAPTAGAAPAGQAAAPEAHGGLDPSGPVVEQISLADARARFDAGTAVFVDVRGGADFAAGHIPGALTITSPELEQRMSELPEGAVVIAYGDANRRESGQRGAQIFMQLGYATVIALEGGFQDWRDAGHPVEGTGDSVQGTG
jgi:rhodanese-related sulfurtransferase